MSLPEEETEQAAEEGSVPGTVNLACIGRVL